MNHDNAANVPPPRNKAEDEGDWSDLGEGADAPEGVYQVRIINQGIRTFREMANRMK